MRLNGVSVTLSLCFDVLLDFPGVLVSCQCLETLSCLDCICRLLFRLVYFMSANCVQDCIFIRSFKEGKGGSILSLGLFVIEGSPHDCRTDKMAQ